MILDLAGLEVTFFTTALAQHESARSKPCLRPESLGVCMRLGGNIIGTADLIWLEGYSCSMIWFAVKLKERGKKWRKWVEAFMMVFVFPCNGYMCWSPAFQEVAGCLPADGRQWINSLFCLTCHVHFTFALLNKLSLLYWRVGGVYVCKFPHLNQNVTTTLTKVKNLHTQHYYTPWPFTTLQPQRISCSCYLLVVMSSPSFSR